MELQLLEDACEWFWRDVMVKVYHPKLFSRLSDLALVCLPGIGICN